MEMKKGHDLKIREKLSKSYKYLSNRRNRCVINYDKDV